MKIFLRAACVLLMVAAPMEAQVPQPPSTSASQVKTSPPVPAGDQNGQTANASKSIEVQVNLVNVLFTVTDKKKHLVLNLTQNDFHVLEDGVPQTITHFSRETDLPLRIGVLVDSSNSIRERLRFEQEAAIDFLDETLRPGEDEAFVVGFDVEPQLLQDYTDDTDKLSQAIRSIEAGGGTGLFDALYYACKQKMLFLPPPVPYLRRVLIVVSDGMDNNSEHSRDEALAMAQRAEVTIFAISTNRSGLTGRGDKVLEYFANQTGGRSFFPFEASDLGVNFQEIAKELRSQYSLAYVSSNPAHNGTFRRITIKPQLRGLSVRAKAGYFAPSQ
ncbi:MAG TPA: VWA domain-containing protein [Terriglobia bacterium]|nr:VWA domain-containing protein [Terriglobia bacterium]